MPGPAPNPNKVGRHKTSKAVIAVEVVPAAAQGVPGPPEGIRSELVGEWEALWRSPLADTIAVTDLPALGRLFSLRERHARYLESVSDDGLDWGSQSQRVMHPAMKAALALESAIAGLEDRFGLSVKARQSMGIRMGQLADAESKVRAAAESKKGPKRADPRQSDSGSAASKRRRKSGPVDGGSSPSRGGRSRG